MKIEGFVFDPDEITAVLDGRVDPAADFSRSANPARAPPLQLSLDFCLRPTLPGEIELSSRSF